MPTARKRVVYLFGAGASHACVKAVGSAHGILMTSLTTDLAGQLRERAIKQPYDAKPEVLRLVNEVIDNETTDYEQIITFLDNSVSALHRALAGDLRTIFESVLRKRLEAIEKELGSAPVHLYTALLDMYELADFDEVLQGCLTLNYDGYLETAVRTFPEREVDFGVQTAQPKTSLALTTVLKLHGSFGWENTWPIKEAQPNGPLWIPPGIQKAKDRYPFNMLWWRAREILDCDILRIVGCQLGPNDWDLISLLFSTRHTHSSAGPYTVEVIDSPGQAARMRMAFPYLDPKSILEVEPIGPYLISELVGGDPRPYDDLKPDEKEALRKASGRNWFLLWLKHKAESTYTTLGNSVTTHGHFAQFLEQYV